MSRQRPDNSRRTELRRLRFNAGLSQAQLAALAGLSRQTIVDVESGKQQPTAPTAKAIADALGVKSEDILTELAA